MRRFLNIRSRHPSCDALRRQIRVVAFSVYRHGSVTPTAHKKEINTIESVKKSSSKLLMKKAFDEYKVRHLLWMPLSEAKLVGETLTNDKVKIPFPVVVKHTHGSRGRGNYKINNGKEFEEFLRGKTAAHYIVEQFFSGAREYRVHITEEGPVYCLRKLLKEDTPKEKRWVRNDETCNWIMEHPVIRDENGKFQGFRAEEGEKFDKPKNWDKIIEDCKKALKSVGLDIGAVDLKVQSASDKDGKPRANPDYYIIEINSAPSLGTVTAEVYKIELPKILQKKYKTP